MRLDKYLTHNNIIDTRSKALDLIKRDLVLVNGKICNKQSFEISETDKVEVLEKLKYVSRAGLKLEEAIKYFKIDVKDKIFIDCGLSTGGFSDYLLQNNAKLIYGVDVGTNQVDNKIKNDDRLKVFEQTNFLDFEIPENDFILIDVSFTSSIPILKHCLNKTKNIILLIKPQFEVGPSNLKNGICKNKKTAETAVYNIISFMNLNKYNLVGFFPVSLTGKKGNQEYMAYFKI